MTDKDLDFSGFQTERKVSVPPPKKKASSGSGKPKPQVKSDKKKPKAPTKGPGTGQAFRPAAASEAPLKSPTGRKNRVNVSLPVDLSRRFTDKAAREDRYLTDMVLDAYRNHYTEMLDEYLAERGDSDAPFRPRRTRAPRGRVTHMLYMASPEIAVIDDSARQTGRSRSELVSQLLERELA